MIKVKVFIKTEERYDYEREAFTRREISYEGTLVGVFWHPLDGPAGAVMDEHGNIDTHKLENITGVTAEEK